MITLMQAISQVRELNGPTHMVWDMINDLDGRVFSDGTYVSQTDLNAWIANN